MSKIKAKKHWSQNFFQDPELLALTLETLDLQADDKVLEVGPGQGVLTEILLEQVAEVWAVEVDPELVFHLKRHFQDEPRLTLIHQDFMRYDLDQFFPEAPLSQRKFIANIPYHLTTPILMKVLNETVFKQGINADTPYFSDICLMVQKEVAERLCASPGTKAYGAITVATQYAADTEILAILPKHLFKPQPKVDSALIRLQPRTEALIETPHLQLMWKVVRQIYQMRRKTLRNVLKAMGIEQAGLEEINKNTDLKLRGEVLGLERLVQLTTDIARVQAESAQEESEQG